MAVKIKLKRMGAPHKPYYRIVVVESKKHQNNRSIEVLGQYNPVSEPVLLNVKKQDAQSWMKKGAQPSQTVKRLFRKCGVIE